MERTEFIRLLEELFEMPAGALTGAEKLEELERWDSLAMMSYIALADEHYGVTLSPRKFLDCKTVNDLISLASTGAAGGR
jgi:acyl carrier protein